MSPNDSPDFEQLIEYLRQHRGFDFTGYKRATLMRRITKRVQQLGLQSFGDYVDYLEVHPDEFPLLFNSILINVTEFFRDKPAWDYLAQEIIPKLVEKSDRRPIRVWSAGCASGEEPYSAAMLLGEAMGPDRFAEQVKIYATDIDEEALSRARLGYTSEVLARVPEDLAAKYFEHHAGRSSFKPQLRRTIIFGRHDLLQDAPISRIDLLICRNVMMYFTADSQANVLSRFHYALNEDGCLFMGRAEMLLTHTDLFAPLELKHRLFSKVPRLQLRDRVALLAQAGNLDGNHLAGGLIRLAELAGEQLPLAQLVIDAHENLVAANRLARSTFGLTTSEIARPLKDLELSYRPLELRSHVSESTKTRKPVSVSGVQHVLPDGRTGVFDVQIIPLVDDRGEVLGTSISFTDISERLRLERDLDRVRHEVETANEELQSSNEELETTNEELQSTVEELETTNEELQSANEELETMNEELESTNSELQAINIDLRQRTDEIDRLNTVLEAVLSGSLQLGVAVLDKELKVLMWNSRSQELWGVREDEALGRSFFGLDIGLPVEHLRPLIRDIVAGKDHGISESLQATNRRGRPIAVRVSARRVSSVSTDGDGVAIVVEELQGDHASGGHR